MPNLVLFHEFGKYLGDGTIDLDTHTFKAMLSNTAPTQGTNTVKADITEISAGNGYSAGGATLGSVTWTETGSGTGIWRFDSADIAFTALRARGMENEAAIRWRPARSDRCFLVR
jgi:hypothetical protein